MWRMSFQTKALLGYLSLALVVALGTALSLRRLAAMADEQIAPFRAEEREITFVERLRWRSEVIVSDGRGYLLSGDPVLLTELEGAVDNLDENVRTIGTAADPFVAQAEQAAKNFRRVQRDLTTARQQSDDTRSLIARFENELLPLRRELDQALARLVDHKQAALENFYMAA
jgi:CHASE3 domain sensor protein